MHEWLLITQVGVCNGAPKITFIAELLMAANNGSFQEVFHGAVHLLHPVARGGGGLVPGPPLPSQTFLSCQSCGQAVACRVENQQKDPALCSGPGLLVPR